MPTPLDAILDAAFLAATGKVPDHLNTQLGRPLKITSLVKEKIHHLHARGRVPKQIAHQLSISVTAVTRVIRAGKGK